MASVILTVDIEPTEGANPSYLLCAPSNAANNESGCLNLFLRIKNHSSSTIHVNKIEVSVKDLSIPVKEFDTDLTIPGGEIRNWVQPEDYLFGSPDNPELKLRIFRGVVNPVVLTPQLKAHKSPTPEKSFRFWGAVRDLRPGEFWQMHGSSHANTTEQMFAYDVGVAVNDESQADGYNRLLPGTDGSKNEHYRIWNKPIYAVADGVVEDFRYYFPTNPIPGEIPAELEKFWTGKSEGGMGESGGGNFISIRTGDEIVGYAHMRTNSLNPKFLSKGALVKKGDFLGLAGNSGSSSEPHLHIDSRSASTGVGRPMPFHNAHAIAWTSLQEPLDLSRWVKLNSRGVPLGHCAVWPSDSKVVELKNVTIRHFSIGTDGRLWIVTSSNRVITSSDPLSVSGAFMDVATAGGGHEIALRGEKAYIIGMDQKIWALEPSGWTPVEGSPQCLRLTVDITSGRLWMVSLDNHIWSYNPPTDAWFENPEGRAKDICVLGGSPFVIGMDDKIWKGQGQSWDPLPGGFRARRIAADESRDKLWRVDPSGHVSSSSPGGNGPWAFPGVMTDAKDIYVHAGTPYILGSDNRLWKSAFKFGWSKMNVVEPK